MAIETLWDNYGSISPVDGFQLPTPETPKEQFSGAMSELAKRNRVRLTVIVVSTLTTFSHIMNNRRKALTQNISRDNISQ